MTNQLLHTVSLYAGANSASDLAAVLRKAADAIEKWHDPEHQCGYFGDGAHLNETFIRDGEDGPSSEGWGACAIWGVEARPSPRLGWVEIGERVELVIDDTIGYECGECGHVEKNDRQTQHGVIGTRYRCDRYQHGQYTAKRMAQIERAGK